MGSGFCSDDVTECCAESKGNPFDRNTENCPKQSNCAPTVIDKSGKNILGGVLKNKTENKRTRTRT